MNLDPLIRACQRAVNVDDDGKAGQITWKAIYRTLTGREWAEGAPVSGELVDTRSEGNIATLLPEVRPYARGLVNVAKSEGIIIKITSGTRTYEEQTRLFNQPRDGRDNDGDGRVDEADEKVTNAPAGYSSHNFGTAFDVTIFNGATSVWESPLYRRLGVIGKSLGLSWGGDWTSPDEPHFYLKPTWARSMSEQQMMAELRRRKSTGEKVYV